MAGQKEVPVVLIPWNLLVEVVAISSCIRGHVPKEGGRVMFLRTKKDMRSFEITER